MPIKVKLHDSTSQVEATPTSGTLSDKRLEILLREEIANRIAADAFLQEEIDEVIENGAWYLSISENENGSIDISLLNKEEQVLCTRTIHLTEKIIKSGILDYENSKLIYTCNDDSTIELDVSDIVSAIHQLESDLANEIARATQAEANLHQEIVDEHDRAVAAEEALDDKLDQEIQDRIDDVDAEELRATTREDEIEDALEDEVARATQAEQDLNTRIDNLDLQEVGQDGYYIKKVKQDDGQLSATKQAFDTSFSNASDNTNAPTSKAVKDYVDAETTRATNAEQAITTRIDNMDLATVGSDGGYIKTVGQQDGQLSATRQAFDVDMTNATHNNAPTTKNSKDYTDAQVTIENNRAIEEETKLGQAIEAEEDRAKLAEQTLQDNIDSEETRAKGVEQQIIDDLADEASTRATNDATLQDNIDAEELARQNADTALNGRIDALDLSTVGSDGGYIKTISQVDGQVSASRQAFDTTLTGSTDNNVPTSKTVKDYVDSAKQALDTRIDNLDFSELGEDGSYIKKVKQQDGQLSATKQTFDTSLTNADNTNAPTSKTVKDYVDAETTRATNAESALGTRIDNLDLSEVGANGSYIKLVSQNNGQVSATSQALDTTISASSDDNNAPTSKAVKDYVDTYGGKIDTISILGVNQPIVSKNVDLPTVRTDVSNQNLSSTQKTNAKTNLDLNNVDNTSDANKPISTATQNALDGLSNTITSVDNKLNVNVHIEGNSDEITYNGDIVTKTSPYQNLKTGATGSRSETIKLADGTNAGLMSIADYATIQDNKRRIDALEGTPVRLIYTASQTPTATQIKTFVDTYLASKGVTTPTDSDYNSVSVKINGTNHIWNYYANDSAYKDDGLDTVTQFTNNIAGIILGSSNDGQVYAETNGTGSVYGWSALKTRVTNLETGMVSDINYDTSNDKLTKTKNGVTSDVVSASTLKADMNLDQVANGAQVNVIETIKVNGTTQTVTSKEVDITIPTKTSDLSNDSDFTTNSYVNTELAKKQNTIDSSHKLSADLVDDSSTTHKFVTTSEKNTWSGKQDALQTQTAYTSKGSATKVPQITTNSLGQVTSISEVTITDNNDNQTVKGNGTSFGANDVIDIIGSGTTTVTGNATNKTITISSSDSHVGDVVSVGATSGSHIAIGGTSANPTVGVASGYSIPSTSDQSTWSGKQDAINSSNKLSSDLVDDTNKTHLFVSSSEKSTWNNKQNALTTQTAYSAKGTSLKVPQITTNTLGQVTKIDEVDISVSAPNDGVLTIQKNGTSLGTFTANQSTNETINISVPTDLDSIADGSSRKLSNYLPLSGGTITGPISWNGETALPQKDLQYILGIDSFASGGQTGWQSKSSFLSGYATETWVSTYYLPLAGGTMSGNINFGDNTRRIGQQDSSTLTRYNSSTVTLPSGNGKGVAIVTDEGGDFGLLFVGSDGAVIANSGDNGYVLKVYDKDQNATDFTSSSGLLLGVKQSSGGTYIAGDLEVGSTIYENGTALSSKYLGISAKAADSDLLDGHDSSYFATSSALNSYLPLIGGTLCATDNNDTPLEVQNSAIRASSHGAYIAFKDSYGYTKGYFSVNENSKPIFYDSQDREIITSATIGSQSVSYANTAGSATSATSAGDADTVDGEHASAFVHKSGDTMIGALNVYSTGNNRANINLISVADVPNDLYFGSNGSSHWSISSRDSDAGNFIGLYDVGLSNWIATVNYSTGVTKFSYRPTVNGTNVALSGEAQPASDVYSWAKQPSKPSYNFSEIQPGTAVVDYSGGIVFRNETTAWYSGIYYSTPNAEAVIFANKSQGNQDASYQQQWLFAYTDMQNREAWTDLGSKTAMQIKGHRVAINKMVGYNTQIPYNLDVNGSANATTITVNTKATLQYNTSEDCLDFIFA